MSMSLENWLINKLQETEDMHDYTVSTETVKLWIDEYKSLNKYDGVYEEQQLTCKMCGSLKLENCGDGFFSCEECGHYPN